MEALAHQVTLTLPDGSTKQVAVGDDPRRGRGRHRPPPGEGRARRQDRRKARRPRRAGSARTRRSRSSRRSRRRRSSSIATPRRTSRPTPSSGSSRRSRSASGRRSRTATTTTSRPERPFTPDDLAAIEAEMRKIVAENNSVERLEMSKDEAIRIFEGQNDPLKVEIIRGIPDERVSCYRQKDFIDLCRGPHVPSTGRLGVFKLTHTAGAYWKGDEKNPMLQRIYGACFLTQKELDDYLKQQEEARARDHRKLGKELDLVAFHPWAPASPFFLPKGAAIYNGLLEYLREEYARRGYQEVMTPQIFDAELFKLSGHYAELLREHVLDGDRRAGVRHQADELPRPLPALQDAALVLPRPARAPRRLRPAAPLRALGRDRRADARPVLFAGRRPHLHAVREGRGRDLPFPRVHGRGLRSVRLHGRGDLARPAPGEADRHGRAVGAGQSGPSRRRSRRRSARTS